MTVGRLANYPETMYPNAALLSFQLSRDEITAILSRARGPNLDLSPLTPGTYWASGEHMSGPWGPG
jgi:hypothetical protein